MNNKNNFYYEGVFYKDQEKFFEAARAFASSPVSPISFERMWKVLGQEIITNIFNVYKYPQINNENMQELLDETMIFFLENFIDKGNQININNDTN